MAELRDLSFDEILETYGDVVLSFKAWGKDQEARMISDSYVGSTGEAMIIRKLRNVATRTFPKNFDTTVMEKIYESTFEERYDKPAIETVIKEDLRIEMDKNAGKQTILKVEEDNVKDEFESKEDRQTQQTDTTDYREVETSNEKESEVDGEIILNPHDKIKQMIQDEDIEIESEIDDDLEGMFD
jgi:hypothetical protein